MGLDLNLSSDLLFNLVLHDLLLIKDLESNDELGLLLSSEEHLPKLSAGERLSDFEIIDAPLFRIELLRLGLSCLILVVGLDVHHRSLRVISHLHIRFCHLRVAGCKGSSGLWLVKES